MAYATQPWVDNVTPVDAARMLHIESGIEATVDADSVVAAASTLVQSKLLLADTQPAFRVLGDGKIEWGPGGATAPDTNLYRSGANQIKTDDAMRVVGDFIANQGAAGQLWANSGGTLYFGTALDTSIFRAAADTLATDDTIQTRRTALQTSVESKLLAADSQPAIRILGDGKHEWGAGGTTATDTNLYRSAAADLTTNAKLNAASFASRPTGGQVGWHSNPALSANYMLYHQIQGEANPRLTIDGTGGISWGPGSTATDTNLYRSAADTLQTDDEFVSAVRVKVVEAASGTAAERFALYATADGSFPRWWVNQVGTIWWGSGAAAADVNLYRSAVNTLHTDDTFEAGGAVYANVGAANQAHIGSDGRLYFGLASDTNLYRSAADNLKTDDTFSCLQLATHGTTGHVYVGSAFDTYLYRQSAGVLSVTRLRIDEDSGFGNNWTPFQVNIGGVGVKRMWVGAADSHSPGLRSVAFEN